MGYYTSYTITKVDGDVMAFSRAFNQHKHARVDGYQWFGVGVPCGEEFSWHGHEQHIADAMLAAGVEGIDLHGEGEEQGDIWDKEFRLVRGTGERIHTVKVTTFRSKIVREKDGETTTIAPVPITDAAKR